MYEVDLYAKVRRAVMVEGTSERAAARQFGIDRKTVSKMLKHSVPPGYQRKEPPVSPKLGPFVGRQPASGDCAADATPVFIVPACDS